MKKENEGEIIMDKEIILNLTCKGCSKDIIGRFLLNIRTDNKGNYRINIPFETLQLGNNEVELQSKETILDNKLNLFYNCPFCGVENIVSISVTDELKKVSRFM